MAFGVTQIDFASIQMIEGIFKEYQNRPDLYRFFAPKAADVPTNNKGRVIATETKPNASIAFGNMDGGDLATPGNSTLNNFTVTWIFFNTALAETYAAMQLNDKATAGDPLAEAVKSSADQFYQWLNYYVSDGNGTTRLATASAAYSGGTPTIFTANGATDTIGAARIVDGMTFFVYDSTGTTQRTGTVGAGALTVSSHTNTAVTASTNLPSDFISGDILVPTGGNTVGFKGLPYLVNNTGNYFDKSRSAVPQYQSTVVAAGGALSATLLMQLFYQTSIKSGRPADGDVSWMSFCCPITQLQAYYNLTTTNTQYMHTTEGRPGIDIGGKNLQFTWFGARLRPFYWIQGSTLYLLDFSDEQFGQATLKSPGQLTALPLGEWYQQFNGSTSSPIAARAKWWDFAGDWFCRRPFMQSVMTGLTVSGLTTVKGSY